MNIDAKERSLFISKLKKCWLINPDDPRAFWKKLPELRTYTYFNHVYSEFCDFAVDYLTVRWQSQIENGKLSLQEVDEMIFNQPFAEVRERMWSIIDIWNLWYKGPVASLDSIASNEQSVHTTTVLKLTNDGIGILEGLVVASGQKTLDEIKAAWLVMYSVDSVERVIADMKDWGSRPTVMHKSKNTYRNVLRGLWSKIKGFEGDLYSEVLKRLWEECNEAVGMCADGHVGRLVNVLVGFDEQFKNNISPMEYFQNNIALIAANDSPLRFKIEHAIKLMDEVGLPEDQRASWLEAF